MISVETQTRVVGTIIVDVTKSVTVFTSVIVLRSVTVEVTVVGMVMVYAS